jgi:hypothetical protein
VGVTTQVSQPHAHTHTHLFQMRRLAAQNQSSTSPPPGYAVSRFGTRTHSRAASKAPSRAVSRCVCVYVSDVVSGCGRVGVVIHKLLAQSAQHTHTHSTHSLSFKQRSLQGVFRAVSRCMGGGVWVGWVSRCCEHCLSGWGCNCNEPCGN